MSYQEFAHHPSPQPQTSVLTADDSGSTATRDATTGETRHDGISSAMRAYVDEKRRSYPNDWVGIVQFESRARTLQEPVQVGRDYPKLERAISRFTPPAGGTSFHAGLEETRSVIDAHALNTMPTPPSMAPAAHYVAGLAGIQIGGPAHVVLITDGHDNGDRSATRHVADDLRSRGVVISCIGVAGSRDEVDEIHLEDIASLDPQTGRKRYRFIHDADREALIQEFRSMARYIQPYRG